MAFEFPRRDRHSIFFPTLHIHDRTVHPEANFDHALFCLPDHALRKDLRRAGWLQFRITTGEEQFSDIAKQVLQLPHSGQTLYGRQIEGRHKNEDIFLRRTTWKARLIGLAYRIIRNW